VVAQEVMRENYEFYPLSDFLIAQREVSYCPSILGLLRFVLTLLEFLVSPEIF
jgi:hypothetical protein